MKTTHTYFRFILIFAFYIGMLSPAYGYVSMFLYPNSVTIPATGETITVSGEPIMSPRYCSGCNTYFSSDRCPQCGSWGNMADGFSFENIASSLSCSTNSGQYLAFVAAAHGLQITVPANATGQTINGSIYVRYKGSTIGTISYTQSSLPALQSGSIGGTQSVISGNTPSALTNTASASGGNGSITYQWEHKTTGSWTVISGATGASYQPGSLTTTTTYRRKATSGTQTGYSNEVTVTVVSKLAAGSIGAAQTIISGNAPSALTNTASAGGGSGTITYQWEHKTTGNWTAISGATSTTYQPPALTTTTTYRRKASNGSGVTLQTCYSNEVIKTVIPTLVAGSIGGVQSIISGNTPSALTNTASASGGNGTITYQWEHKTTGSWTAISGATSTTYQPPALTATTTYRRKASNGSGATLQTYYSNEVTKTVIPTLVAGSIGGAQSIVSGNAPSVLTNTAAASGGSGTITYQWEHKTTGSWAAISGATSATYQPAALTATTTYRRKASNGSGATLQTYYSNEVIVTVIPKLVAGSISGVQSIVSGNTPTALTSTASASGGSGTITYQWEYKTTGSWTAISGATSTTYQPPMLTATTTYRRKATNGSGTTLQTDYSNEVAVTVIPTLAAGSIGGEQTILSGSTPTALTNTASASGGSGTTTYQWEHKTTGSWTAISSATSTAYQPGALATTTTYRRKATSGTQTYYSNEVIVTVIPTLVPGSIGTTQSIITGSAPSALTNTASASGGSGTITYQWESKTTGSWAAISSATSTTYQPPALTATTTYRRKVTNGSGATLQTYYSNEVAVTVVPKLVPGSIGTAQTIIGGNAPAALTNTASASGGSGTITYQWESKTTGSWAAISGATSTTYQPAALTATTTYRRKVTNGSGTTLQTYYSNEIKITVIPKLVAGSIGTAQSIISGSKPSALTNTASASGGSGTITYQWEHKTTGSWTAISGATSTTYQPAALTATTTYRRKVTNGSGATLQTYYSNEIKITVVPKLVAGSIGGAQNIVIGSTPAALTNTASASGGSGTIAYQWEQKTTGSWAAISGATGATYQPPALAVTTTYRRKVTNGSGTTLQTYYSNEVEVAASSADMIFSNLNYIVSYTPAEASTNISQLQPQSKGAAIVYYDGLGRPMQQSAIMASPLGKDIVTPIEYDPMNRQDKDYLPYSTAGNLGSFRSNAVATQAGWYTGLYTPEDGQNASGRRLYEASPLNRVAKEYLPGGGAYATNATIDHIYTTNANGEVRLWTAQGHNNQYYAPGTLYVHEVSDPDNRITRTYTDMQGRTVETRQISGAETLTTSYAYDALGRLQLVIPPKAQTETYNNDAFKKLVYRYTYDDRNRCVEKKLPDSEPIYYVYDKADRLIMSQDGNQRLTNEWTVIKYDKFGRPVITGYLTAESTATRGSLQSAYGGTVVKEESSTGGIYGYTNTTGPQLTTASVLTVSYYDSDTTYLYGSNAQLAHVPQSGYPARCTNTTGQLIGTLVKRLDDSTKLIIETMHYDNHRRPIQTRNLSETGGLTVAYTDYSFTGQPAKSEVQHQLTTGGAITTEKYEYSYDHAGRLTALKHGVNAAPTTLATYSYDELGRQQQKKLKNGDVTVETIASSYDIQSRLTALQSAKFSQQLLYHTGATPQYGGNISVAKWTQYGTDQQTYTYSYDGFSRLLEGKHSGASPANTESQTYDANGNMLTIARSGAQAQDLELTYSGNQLATTKIGSTIYAYTYDANGNMKTDGIRGMTMAYNRLNLPQTVSKGSDVLAYGYSADGQKREKKYNNTVTQQYRGAMVYDGSGAPEYVLTPEGMVRKTGSTWVRQYNLTDHLGNTRAVLDPNGGVSQQTDYYPFGTAFSVENTNKNKYLYGGKELQDEAIGGAQLNMYDFEARFMDTRIPRFTSIDPMVETYYSFSPYAYVANNPMRYIDLDGRRIVVASDVDKTLTNLSKIAATNIGQDRINRLRTSRATYRTETVFLTTSSAYDAYGEEGPSRTIYYVASPWKSRAGGGSISSMIALGHELNHAYDHDRNESMLAIPPRERSAVSFANYLRSVYSEGPMRSSYSGVRADGKRFTEYFSTSESFYNPTNEKISEFSQIGKFSGNGSTFLGFSYNKSEDGKGTKTEYMISTTMKDGTFLYVKFDTKEEYEERMNYIKKQNGGR